MIDGCPNSGDDATRFLSDMERQGGGEARRLTDDFLAATPPHMVVARGFGAYWPFGPERFLPVTLSDSHTLSANRAWEREDLPVGYDRFLKRKLDDGRHLFPDLFPKVP